jgi:hypothetical protein
MVQSGMGYSNEALAYVYEIEKTVELHLMKGGIYRLEVVRCMKGTSDVHYAVRCFERLTRYIAPNGTIGTESVPLAIPYYIWVPGHSLPWVNQHSADAALCQAVDWLAEHRNNDSPL